MPATISLCMIVKNEEAVLARCLEQARRIADEIIIVDTGSTDRTVEIARRYTSLLYSFDWRDDFAAARNFSFSKATMEYLLWLDADDFISGENVSLLLELKKRLPDSTDVVMLRYNAAFDEDGVPLFHYYRERIVRRECGFRWTEPVHEYLPVSGQIRQYDIAIDHKPPDTAAHTGRNLAIYQKQLAAGKELSPRACYYYARELYAHERYGEAADWYRKFLTFPDIWKEDAIWACGDLADCLVVLGNEEQALHALYQSFLYDLPRAEILCRIGYLYMTQNKKEEAVFWYETTLRLPRPTDWGFLSEDHWGFIPHIQLCVLLDQLGQRERAVRHHLEAKALKPADTSVLHNENWFFG